MSVKKYGSMAGTGAEYVGTDQFRIRKTGDSKLRVHFPKAGVREREKYYAVDIDIEDLTKAIGFILAGVDPEE